MSDWRPEAIHWLREVFPAFDWTMPDEGRFFRDGVCGSLGNVSMELTARGLSYNFMISHNRRADHAIMGYSDTMHGAVNDALERWRQIAEDANAITARLPDLSPRPAPTPVDDTDERDEPLPPSWGSKPVEIDARGGWGVLSARDECGGQGCSIVTDGKLVSDDIVVPDVVKLRDAPLKFPYGLESCGITGFIFDDERYEFLDNQTGELLDMDTVNSRLGAHREKMHRKQLIPGYDGHAIQFPVVPPTGATVTTYEPTVDTRSSDGTTCRHGIASREVACGACMREGVVLDDEGVDMLTGKRFDCPLGYVGKCSRCDQKQDCSFRHREEKAPGKSPVGMAWREWKHDQVHVASTPVHKDDLKDRLRKLAVECFGDGEMTRRIMNGEPMDGPRANMKEGTVSGGDDLTSLLGNRPVITTDASDDDFAVGEKVRAYDPRAEVLPSESYGGLAWRAWRAEQKHHGQDMTPHTHTLKADSMDHVQAYIDEVNARPGCSAEWVGGEWPHGHVATTITAEDREDAVGVDLVASGALGTNADPEGSIIYASAGSKFKYTDRDTGQELTEAEVEKRIDDQREKICAGLATKELTIDFRP